MILTSRNDLNVPIEAVYEELTDVGAYQRMAARQGAALKLEAGDGSVSKGAVWSSALMFRGKERQIRMEVTETEPPKVLELESESGGMRAMARIQLVRLSPRETRMSVKIKLKPRTLSARLIVQSLKLTRPTVTRKFTERADKFAHRLEANLRSKAG